MKNTQYSTLLRRQELNSRISKMHNIYRNLLPLETVSLIKRHKSYEFFSHAHVDQSLLNLWTKFLGKKNRLEKTAYFSMSIPSSSVTNIIAIDNGIN